MRVSISDSVSDRLNRIFGFDELRLRRLLVMVAPGYCKPSYSQLDW